MDVPITDKEVWYSVHVHPSVVLSHLISEIKQPGKRQLFIVLVESRHSWPAFSCIPFGIQSAEALSLDLRNPPPLASFHLMSPVFSIMIAAALSKCHHHQYGCGASCATWHTPLSVCLLWFCFCLGWAPGSNYFSVNAGGLTGQSCIRLTLR